MTTISTSSKTARVFDTSSSKRIKIKKTTAGTYKEETINGKTYTSFLPENVSVSSKSEGYTIKGSKGTGEAPSEVIAPVQVVASTGFALKAQGKDVTQMSYDRPQFRYNAATGQQEVAGNRLWELNISPTRSHAQSLFTFSSLKYRESEEAKIKSYKNTISGDTNANYISQNGLVIGEENPTRKQSILYKNPIPQDFFNFQSVGSNPVLQVKKFNPDDFYFKMAEDIERLETKRNIREMNFNNRVELTFIAPSDNAFGRFSETYFEESVKYGRGISLGLGEAIASSSYKATAFGYGLLFGSKELKANIKQELFKPLKTGQFFRVLTPSFNKSNEESMFNIATPSGQINTFFTALAVREYGATKGRTSWITRKTMETFYPDKYLPLRDVTKPYAPKGFVDIAKLKINDKTIFNLRYSRGGESTEWISLNELNQRISDNRPIVKMIIGKDNQGSSGTTFRFGVRNPSWVTEEITSNGNVRYNLLGDEPIARINFRIENDAPSNALFSAKLNFKGKWLSLDEANKLSYERNAPYFKINIPQDTFGEPYIFRFGVKNPSWITEELKSDGSIKYNLLGDEPIARYKYTAIDRTNDRLSGDYFKDFGIKFKPKEWLTTTEANNLLAENKPLFGFRTTIEADAPSNTLFKFGVYNKQWLSLNEARGLINENRPLFTIKTGRNAREQSLLKINYLYNPSPFAKRETIINPEIKSLSGLYPETTYIRFVEDYTIPTSLKELKGFEGRIANTAHITSSDIFKGKESFITTATPETLKFATGNRQQNMLLNFYLSSPNKNSVFRNYLGYVGIMGKNSYGITGERVIIGKPVIRSLLLKDNPISKTPSNIKNQQAINRYQARFSGKTFIAPENLAYRSNEGQFTIPSSYKSIPEAVNFGLQNTPGSIISKAGESKFAYYRKQGANNLFLGDFFGSNYYKIEFIPGKVSKVKDFNMKSILNDEDITTLDVGQYNKSYGKIKYVSRSLRPSYTKSSLNLSRSLSSPNNSYISSSYASLYPSISPSPYPSPSYSFSPSPSRISKPSYNYSPSYDFSSSISPSPSPYPSPSPRKGTKDNSSPKIILTIPKKLNIKKFNLTTSKIPFKQKYFASVEATLLNIRGKPSKTATITGLEIRPIRIGA